MQSRRLFAAGIVLSLASLLAASLLGRAIPYAAGLGGLVGATWGSFGAPMAVRAWRNQPWWLSTLLPPIGFALGCAVITSLLGESAIVVSGSSVALAAWAMLAQLGAIHWRTEKLRRRA